MNDATVKLINTILDLLGKLAWPGVVLFCILKFGKQIADLLHRLGSFKVAGSEWIFQPASSKALEAPKEFNKRELEIGADGFLTGS
jgi:hypothetical protein